MCGCETGRQHILALITIVMLMLMDGEVLFLVRHSMCCSLGTCASCGIGASAWLSAFAKLLLQKCSHPVVDGAHHKRRCWPCNNHLAVFGRLSMRCISVPGSVAYTRNLSSFLRRPHVPYCCTACWHTSWSTPASCCNHTPCMLQQQQQQQHRVTLRLCSTFGSLAPFHLQGGNTADSCQQLRYNAPPVAPARQAAGETVLHTSLLSCCHLARCLL